MDDDVSQLLRSAHERAVARWGALGVTRARFAAYVLERAPRSTSAVSALCLEDLYLACGCVDGQRAALVAFDAQLLPHIRPRLRRGSATPSEVTEWEQRLRVRLLVPEEGKAPRLATYSGKAPLTHWLRVAATRVALNARRGKVADGSLQHERLLRTDEAGAEVALLRRRYQPEFSAAFKAALSGLSVRERTLLRLHVLDGVGIDSLAKMRRVHRSTAARWIAEIRAELLERTREELRGRLAAGRSTVDELMRLLRSQLDVSIGQFLGR